VCHISGPPGGDAQTKANKGGNRLVRRPSVWRPGACPSENKGLLLGPENEKREVVEGNH